MLKLGNLSYKINVLINILNSNNKLLSPDSSMEIYKKVRKILQ